VTELGPHLLGRVPSPPDERDFRLENFVNLGTSDPAADATAFINDALVELMKTTASYKKWAATVYLDPTVTHWWKALANLAAAKQVLVPPPPPPPPPSGGVRWSNPEAILDQGNYGTCVGNGTAQFLNTFPINNEFTEGMGASALNRGPYARALYYEATVLDGWADDPDAPGGGQEGATVRSGMKALKARGRIGSYAQSGDLAVLEAFIRASGSVVVGTDWYSDMFDPNLAGFVVPTGSAHRGHFYLWDEITAGGDYGFTNSWGAGWGVAGRFYMSKTSFDKLLSANGEVWTAVELAL